MRKPTEAEILQASAIVVAAPRYMGAFASAIGIEILTYWPEFAKVEIGSGAAMAILEGWAVAFMFRKWRTMPPGSAHWWVLLVLQLALMLALPATATPYLLSSQLGQQASEIMPLWLLVAWSFTVAAIAPLVLAAVGYADVELHPEPVEGQKQIAEQTQPAPESEAPAFEPAPILQPAPALPAPEQIEQIAPPQPTPAASEPAPVTCPNCGATFAKVQGLSAHKRHCSGALVAANGNGRVKVG
jgi:hypothetical protein